jgi:hypothetical protein
MQRAHGGYKPDRLPAAARVTHRLADGIDSANKAWWHISLGFAAAIPGKSAALVA